jgi:predicted methyltransferase
MDNASTQLSTFLRAALLLVAASLCAPFAAADAADSLTAALADAERPEKDKARDKNRKPLETLAFFGFKEDMRVLELLPGGGWYTRLLAAALEDKGQLYVGIGTQNVEERLLTQPNYSKIKVVGLEADMGRDEGARRFTIRSLKLDVKRLDMVLTFRNMHNFDEAGRTVMNAAVFKALKKGGVYGVVDHTRRHMQGDSDEGWRRMDPVLVIKEIEAAGFEFVDYSDLHYRADDELRYEVGRKSVSGNTDRFTLMFRKP